MKHFKNKQRQYLTILILLSTLIVTNVIFMIIKLDEYLVSTLLLIALILLLLLLFYFKSSFDFYSRKYHYAKLLIEAENPIKLKKTYSIDDIVTMLDNNGYQVFSNDKKYIFLYKVANKNKSKKRRILYATLIFLDPNLSLNDPETNKYFSNLEDSLLKKEKYMHRIFYQININDKIDVKEANNVYFVSSRYENYIFINVLLNNTNKTIYYLHSNTSSPNRFYTLATDNLKEMFIKSKN